MSKPRDFTPSSEWEDRRQLRGLWGERTAMAYLISCGWDIEAHRFKLGRHDVDLVIRRDNTVAFVEVKTRRTVSRGSEVEAVGPRKRSIIAKVAALWCLRYSRPNDEYRYDVVAVRDLGCGRCAVDHMTDAWR
jgi:putative endonuclease